MKSKLAASMFMVRAVTYRTNTGNTMPSRSMLTSFQRRRCLFNSSFQGQGFESSDRAVHFSAIEDDDFSELGPETSGCHAKQIKLVTEKRDNIAKTYPSRRDSASSDARPSLKKIVASIGKAATLNSKLGGRDHAPSSATLTDETKKISNIESPGSVTTVSIKNVPSTVGLSELIESMSVFGKVSSASFVNASNGLRCCKIEFEDIDSSRRAISAGTVAVGSQVFPVQPVAAVDVVAIRIKNVNKETADYVIHSRCKSIGEFVGLARTSKDVVDAFFNVRNDKIQQNILKRLNDTKVDLNTWSAHVLTSKSKPSEVSSVEEARYKLGLQIIDQCAKLQHQVHLSRVYMEDLEMLNVYIMYIESLPLDSRH